MKMTLDLEPIDNLKKDQDLPLIIAGPCSAESEEQMLTTARQIAEKTKTSVFRAGIWKPRTRPGQFEGVGEPGLEWMKTVKKETGLHLATEVANTQHVEACLKAGIDVLWMGARTTVNPFAVQEIADALQGVEATVLVKNPVNPDLQLWIGALERLNKAGVKRLAAIHRGFSAYEQTIFRNIPLWDMAIELRTACPNLPIICDPSHIAGNTELIPFVSQKAIDLDMYGLMIETHNNPKIALSDAKQQLTPSALADLLNTLQYRRSSSENKEFKSKLDELRSEIDKLDEDIIQKFSARMKIAGQIGQYKRDNKVTILQVSRWDDLVKARVNMGKAMGLSEDFMRKMLQLIHQESINIQTDK
jgi:chorismate mutase